MFACRTVFFFVCVLGQCTEHSAGGIKMNTLSLLDSKYINKIKGRDAKYQPYVCQQTSAAYQLLPTNVSCMSAACLAVCQLNV